MYRSHEGQHELPNYGLHDHGFFTFIRSGGRGVQDLKITFTSLSMPGGSRAIATFNAQCPSPFIPPSRKMRYAGTSGVV